MNHKKLFPEFETERVERLRNACSAIGRALHKPNKKREERLRTHYEIAVAATYFRRAAAHSLLLGDFHMASECFREAAQCYRLAEIPYGILMEVLCGTHVGDWPWQKATESPQGVYMLIAGLGMPMLQSDELRKYRYHLDEFRGKHLGTFALPLDQYLDLFDAIYSAAEGSDIELDGVRQAVLPFVQTYSSALQRAKRDSFHWQRLMMVFHPVEPDIVGLLVMTTIALSRSRISHSDLLQGLPVSHDAIDILMYCLDHLIRKTNNRMKSDEE